MLSPVNRFVRKLASRLLAEDRDGTESPLSRNRHYEVFADEQGKGALRLYRRLRSLVRDILHSESHGARTPAVVLHRGGEDDPLPIRLEIPLVGRGVRTAYLNEDELHLLLENPSVRARLNK
jgi:hypothetical protein